MGGGGDPTRTEHSGDVEQQHVPQPHFAAELFFDVRDLRRLYVWIHTSGWVPTNHIKSSDTSAIRGMALCR